MPKTLILSALLLCLVPAGGPADDEAVGKYVYMIRIPATSHHKAILQSGFRLEGTKGIVTALHGVADGTTFSAFNESGDVLNGLTIASVDVSNDLALLRSPELEGRPADGLRAVKTLSLQPGDTLRAFGHPQGINLYIKELKAGTPVEKQLHELIPSDSTQLFDQRKSPSTDITVLNIFGSLVPGDSGAPVFNSNNEVVGVVNGGLLQGAAAISWAIPLTKVKWRTRASAKVMLDELAKLDTKNLFGHTEATDGAPQPPGCLAPALLLKTDSARGSDGGPYSYVWDDVSDELSVVQGRAVVFNPRTKEPRPDGSLSFSCAASAGAVRREKDKCTLDTSSISAPTRVTVQFKATDENRDCKGEATAVVNVTPYLDAFRATLNDLLSAARVKFRPFITNCQPPSSPLSKTERCESDYLFPTGESPVIYRDPSPSNYAACVFDLKLKNDRSPTMVEIEYEKLAANLRKALPDGWEYGDWKASASVLKGVRAASPDSSMTIYVTYGLWEHSGRYYVSMSVNRL